MSRDEALKYAIQRLNRTNFNRFSNQDEGPLVRDPKQAISLKAKDILFAELSGEFDLQTKKFKSRKTFRPEFIEDLVKKSNIDRVAFSACYQALEWYQQMTLPPPTSLSEWANNVLSGVEIRPGGNRGRTSGETEVRDEMLAIVIHELIGKGFKATRHHYNARNSACDIVGEAHTSVNGEVIKYSALAKIWQKHKGTL